MFWVTIGFVLCVTAHTVQGATNTFEWCYQNPTCNDATWPVQAPQFCNGSRQSPIDIVSANATVVKMTDFAFIKYNDTTLFNKIENTGKTVKVTFNSGPQVSGGNLSEPYNSLQFHLHWGNGADQPGSEHTVDGKRYPMEFHIVSIKERYGTDTTPAVADSTGAAALGFFIEEDTTKSGGPAAWQKLTSYLPNITEKGQSVDLTGGMGISLEDLVGTVNTKKFYRYLGSLTTPLCHEAVVWTVFEEPVKVSKDLIDMFSNTVRIGDSSSIFLRNCYRSIQPEQPVTRNSGSKVSSSFGLLVLIVAHWLR